MEAKDIENASEEILIYLLYLYLSGAGTIAEFIKNQQENFLLDKNLTEEQRQLIKKELGFTKRAIRNIEEASKGYRLMCSKLEALQAELEEGYDMGTYDHRFADSNELIAHDILYIYRTHRNPKNELQIRRFMKYMEGGKPSDSITEMCKHFFKVF